MYAVNFTQMLAYGVTKADPKWPTKPCSNGWEFDKEELPYSTISTEVIDISKDSSPSFMMIIL